MQKVNFVNGSLYLSSQEIQILDANRSKWSHHKTSFGGPIKGVYPITETTMVHGYIISELNRVKAAANKAEKKIKAEYTALQDQTKQLTTAVQQLTVSGVTQVKQINSLTQDVKTLQDKLKELDSLKQQKIELTANIETLNQQITDLKSSVIPGMQTAINALTSSIVILEKQNIALSEAIQSIVACLKDSAKA